MTASSLSLRPHESPLSTAVSPEHSWQIESAHTTSEGRVLYVRCAECGARRVDLV